MNLSLCGLFASDFVEELNCLAGLLLDVEAEGLAGDAEVKSVDCMETHQHQDNQAEIH